MQTVKGADSCFVRQLRELSHRYGQALPALRQHPNYAATVQQIGRTDPESTLGNSPTGIFAPKSAHPNLQVTENNLFL